MQILADTACFIAPECRKDVFSVTVPLVQTSPTTHVLHKKMQNEVSRWTTFTTTPFPDCNIQIFMTTISPLMISHNNFTINIEVQQFHHLYCSTRMCHYFISLLPFAWKQQWLIVIVQQIVLFDSIWFHFSLRYCIETSKFEYELPWPFPRIRQLLTNFIIPTFQNIPFFTYKRC